jgi:hypothetical protein
MVPLPLNNQSMSISLWCVAVTRALLLLPGTLLVCLVCMCVVCLVCMCVVSSVLLHSVFSHVHAACLAAGA